LKTDGGKTPLKWTITAGRLPHGMTLSAAGALSGTPTEAGIFPFTVSVADAAKPSDTATATLTLSIAPLVITNNTPYTTQVNKHFSLTLTTNGGVGTRKWSITSGQLPPGLTLSTAGVVSGTPKDFGYFPVTFSVHDSATPANTASMTIAFDV